MHLIVTKFLNINLLNFILYVLLTVELCALHDLLEWILFRKNLNHILLLLLPINVISIIDLVLLIIFFFFAQNFHSSFAENDSKRKWGTVNCSFVSLMMFMRNKNHFSLRWANFNEEDTRIYYFFFPELNKKITKNVRRTSKRHLECSKAKIKANHSIIRSFALVSNGKPTGLNLGLFFLSNCPKNKSNEMESVKDEADN